MIAADDLRGSGMAQDTGDSLGLSYVHISPQPSESDKLLSLTSSTQNFDSRNKALFSVTPGGGLVKVSKGVDGSETPHNRNTKRGNITQMSLWSRRRLLYTLATLDVTSKPIFVTLTYPGKGLLPTPAKVKRDLDVFRKRLARAGLSAVWRLEYKERKSGENAGQVAPHFHLFVWGTEYRDALQLIPSTWYEVVGSLDVDHFSAGTRVEEIHSWCGVLSYTAKYITKQDLELIPVGCGRFWGMINRENIPFVAFDNQSIETDRAVELMRYARRYINSNNAGPKRFVEKDGRRFCVNRKVRFRSKLPTLNVIIRNSDRWQELYLGESQFRDPGMSVGPCPSGVRFVDRHPVKVWP